MRLLNVNTFKLEEFYDDQVPPYAILSHTWGNDSEEVSCRNVEDGTIEKSGIRTAKLDGCCKQAAIDGLRYAWIDTCCIDKANAVELGEAINSMFQWYKRASVCCTYLSDVPIDDDHRSLGSKFFSSRWFQRGWTLQELLAPNKLRFYNSEWRYIGTKNEMSAIIEKITGVPRPFLLGLAELRDASIAQRMSWAAMRVTKRKEDIAYCLLGIFGVMMPMIYGEGNQAFGRLQQEIMKNGKDDSILAWGLDLAEPIYSKLSESLRGGVLASAPSDFVNCGHIVLREQDTTPENSFDIFGGSVRIRLPLFTTSTGETFGLLYCGPGYNAEQVVGIPLDVAMSRAPSDDYIRPQGRCSVLLPRASSESLIKLIHIRKDRQNKALPNNSRRPWFYIEESVETNLELIDVDPSFRWHKDSAMISTVTATAANSDGKTIFKERTLTRFRPRKKSSCDFLVVLDFEIQESQMRAQCHVMISAKSTTLEEVAQKIDLLRQKAFGKQSASNGVLNLNVTCIQEVVAAQPMFVVKLAAVPHSPQLTIDFNLELQCLNLNLAYMKWVRDVDELHVQRRTTARLKEEKQGRLGQIRKSLEEVEEKIRKLSEEKKLLVDELEQESHELDQLVINGGKLSEPTQLGMHDLLRDMFKEEPGLEYRYQEVDKLLLALGIDAELISANGKTPLSWAATKDYEGMAALLIERGAELDERDVHGLTPLSYAAAYGQLSVAQLLLDRVLRSSRRTMTVKRLF